MKTIASMDDSFQILMMLTDAADTYVLLATMMMTWMDIVLLLHLSKTKRMLLCYQRNLLRVGMRMKSSNRVSNRVNKKSSNRVSQNKKLSIRVSHKRPRQ
jgi:hypothetical protein